MATETVPASHGRDATRSEYVEIAGQSLHRSQLALLNAPLCDAGDIAKGLLLRATYDTEGAAVTILRTVGDIRTSDPDLSPIGQDRLNAIRSLAARIHQLNSLVMSYLSDDSVKLRDASFTINCDIEHRELFAMMEGASDD
jgi:hypothetical protein